MGLSVDVEQAIIKHVVETLRNKLRTYGVDDEVKPFHYRLLGKDRMALFSFIHSFNTTFGTSIFEQTAVKIAKNRFKEAKNQVKAFNKISYEAQATIQSIIDQLSSSKTTPNKPEETESIIRASNKENLHEIRTPQVDLWLETYDEELFLIDIKTVKPNIGSFISHKRTLLEWVAVESAKQDNRNIHSLIAMPYNPYEPKPYRSWQLRGMLDLNHELLVGKAFWDFVGGEGAYEDLLDSFEIAGNILRPEIDEHFEKYKLY
jgi:type II restriction enzyme